MKKVRIIAGITWAFISLLLILILFPGLNVLSSSVARLPFMKINPNYTGGEIAREIVVESCTLAIRKPVFDGLLHERKEGFVQLDWRGDIPETIQDTIDYNFDDENDFIISIDRNNSATKMKIISDRIIKVGISTPVSYGWVVRINLLK